MTTCQGYVLVDRFNSIATRSYRAFSQAVSQVNDRGRFSSQSMDIMIIFDVVKMKAILCIIRKYLKGEKVFLLGVFVFIQYY